MLVGKCFGCERQASLSLLNVIRQIPCIAVHADTYSCEGLDNVIWMDRLSSIDPVPD